MSVSVTPGSVWASASGITTADRAAIISYCTRSFVFSLRQEYGYYKYLLNLQDFCTILSGVDVFSSWYGGVNFSNVADSFRPGCAGVAQSFNQNLDNATKRCWGIFSRGSNTTLQTPNQVSIGNDFGGPSGTGYVLTLPSGVLVRRITIAFSPDNSNWAMPFGLVDWCGVSSWSYSFSTPYDLTLYDSQSGFNRTYHTSISFVGYDPGSGAVANGTLRGHTLNFSW